MPVKKQRQLMGRLKKIYFAIFLLTIFLLALFMFKEQHVRELNEQLHTLNYARQDFDAGVLHTFLSDKNNNEWQRRIGKELLEQTIASLIILADKHAGNNNGLLQSIAEIQQQLERLLQSEFDGKSDNSQQIFLLRLQMDNLHVAFRKVLQQELKTNRYWFIGLIVTSFGLMIGLFISLFRNEARRQKFHSKLYTTQYHLSLIAENIDEVFWLQDADTEQVLYVSEAFEKLWQLPCDALYRDPAVWMEKIHPDDKEKVQFQLEQAKDSPTQIEYRVVLDNGDVRWINDRIFPVTSLDEDGCLKRHIVAVASDITPTKKLNDQLMVAQKMDSLGKLTGGIAHDFNNLLTVIMGNAQLLIELLPAESQLSGVARLIAKAAERGASLNKQLLAFASKQHLKPEKTDIATLINEMLHLLRRTLGEKINLKFSQNSLVSYCYVDAGQLQNAVINLCLNARDAMPDGGDIQINLGLSDSGKYAVLSISDSGEGIADNILPHIFEPFFTTKMANKGSGLGLSMVYGFVKQSGGDIQVSSEKGKGTTFRLSLPASPELAEINSDVKPAGRTLKKLLVVEDDAMVRDSVIQLLRDTDYQVFTADNAEEGLALLKAHTNFDILLTDVIMPGSFNGIELADMARAEFPAVKILLMSGYVGELSNSSESFPGYAFLPKPFSKSQLLGMLQQLA